nr:RNA-directed DNA polymerase, eukaryota, reverse transcriptase zinc-binding domain protein [Tanacetum cinerariifolium]
KYRRAFRMTVRGYRKKGKPRLPVTFSFGRLKGKKAWFVVGCPSGLERCACTHGYYLEVNAVPSIQSLFGHTRHPVVSSIRGRPSDTSRPVPSIQTGTFSTEFKVAKGRLRGSNGLRCLRQKKYGGLGVSSYYAFNRALLFKWVWRFISHDNSLWCRFITSMHGSQLLKLSPFHSSNWNTIIREINVLKSQGVDLISHCKTRVGNDMRTQFWNDTWVGDTQLRYMFSRIYALEFNKVCTLADKLQGSVALSLRRTVRGGVEAHQLDLLQNLIGPTILTNLEDRWVWDLNGKGVFRVKDLRNLLDESFLPKKLYCYEMG